VKLIVLIFLFASSNLFSFELATWQRSVVKVSSYPCLTGNPRFEGSGFIVKKDDQFFVITSDHVIINDSTNKICHEAVNGHLNLKNIQLINSSYEKGLAILKVDMEQVSGDHVALNEAPDWSILKKMNGEARDVSAMGFPFSSSDLLVLSNGKLQSSESKRPLIPGISNFIEAVNLPIEFGMSGGVFLDSKSFELVGLVSHQYLKRMAGKPTVVNTNVADDYVNENDIAIGIPMSEIVDYVESVQQEQPTIHFKRNSYYQLKNEEVISYGVLNFRFTNKEASDVWNIGGADGSGVGGTENHQGGNEQASNKEKMSMIEVFLDMNATSNEKMINYSNSILQSFKNSLLKGQKINIVMLKLPNKNSAIRLTSFDQFITYWLRDGFTPLFITSNYGADISYQLRARQIITKEIKIILQKNIDDPSLEGLRSWFTLMREQILLFENNLLDIDLLKELVNVASKENWNAFYQLDFESAVKLESNIQKILN
jgi:hypothetical protein